MPLQTYTMDEDVLFSGIKKAATDALITVQSLILKKTGKTRVEGLKLNKYDDIFIDLQEVPYMSYDNPYRRQMETWSDAQAQFAAEKSRNFVKPMLPIKTGNLRNNALKVLRTEDGQYEIYIDTLIAPYVQYPNVKKIIDKVWPTLVARFQQQLETTIETRNNGLYNNEGTFKVMGGGYYDQNGEFAKTEGGTWEYTRFNK